MVIFVVEAMVRCYRESVNVPNDEGVVFVVLVDTFFDAGDVQIRQTTGWRCPLKIGYCDTVFTCAALWTCLHAAITEIVDRDRSSLI